MNCFICKMFSKHNIGVEMLLIINTKYIDNGKHKKLGTKIINFVQSSHLISLSWSSLQEYFSKLWFLYATTRCGEVYIILR